MKRWTLLLLLLLPFTMAPKIALEPEAPGDGTLAVEVFAPGTTVRAGAALPLRVVITNTSDAPTDAIDAAVRLSMDSATIRRAPKACLTEGASVTCSALDALEAGDSHTLRLVVRPTEIGDLGMSVTAGDTTLQGSAVKVVSGRSGSAGSDR